jgi:hypothetical protein
MSLERVAEVRAIVDAIACEDYHFDVQLDGAVIVRAFYWEEDVYTGKRAVQGTRRWIIEDDATEDDIVKTVLKLVLTSREHRVREHFTYRGARIFGPHQQLVSGG